MAQSAFALGGCLIRYSNISSYVIQHRILTVMMVGKYVLFLHKVPITQIIKVFGFYPHTDFSLIFTLRRTEIFDFYPYTDLLYYDIVSTTSWHVETVVVLRDKKVDGRIGIDLDVENRYLWRAE